MRRTAHVALGTPLACDRAQAVCILRELRSDSGIWTTSVKQRCSCLLRDDDMAAPQLSLLACRPWRMANAGCSRPMTCERHGCLVHLPACCPFALRKGYHLSTILVELHMAFMHVSVCLGTQRNSQSLTKLHDRIAPPNAEWKVPYICCVGILEHVGGSQLTPSPHAVETGTRCAVRTQRPAS